MKNETILDAIITLIFMMFLFVSFSKYFDFSEFRRAMYSQPFPNWFSKILIIFLPPVEISIAILLLKKKFLRTGLLATLVTMSAFTLYIIAILIHIFPNVPCACGGIIRLLTWPRHLIFNIFFLIITIIGLNIQSRQQCKNITPKTE